MASINDKITKTTDGSRPVPTTVTATRSPGVTTLSGAAFSGWESATTAVHFATYQVDTNNEKIDGTQCDWKGLVSGTTITALQLRAGTDIGNNIGDIIECMPTAAWGDDLAQALLDEHDTQGKHTDITATTLSVSTTATLPASSIIPNYLQAGSGTSWGWTAWTPTLANLSLGNGTVTARYTQIGKKVTAYIKVVFGSTSVMGTAPTFTLPVTAASQYGANINVVGTGVAINNGLTYNAFAAINTTVGEVRTMDVSGSYGNIVPVNASTPTSPWTNNDYFDLTFEYEAA